MRPPSLGFASLLGLVLCTVAPACAEPALPDPVTDADYVPTDPAQVTLGRLLFWDPILSGNRNISCGTCHHPRFGTSDGVSLSLGEGGIGLGPDRRADPANLPEQRIPRNSPALFNLGAREFTVLFHDGRIEVDTDRKSGIRTPLGDDMADGFASLLSAQTMFPVLSQDEMAGHYSENDVAKAVRQGRITGPGGAWDIIAKRIEAIAEYRELFEEAFPEVAAGADINFTRVSDAIAAFVAWQWRSDNSPFDRYMRGEGQLDPNQTAGMMLFYGGAGCAACHSGPFQTDHGFHAMGTPQIGPGKAARFESHSRDEGRMRVTGLSADAYAFRTPSLRNVTETAPYGHAGGHKELEEFLRHHIDPAASANDYDLTAALLPPLESADDFGVWSDPDQRSAILAAARSSDLNLTADNIAELIAFLGALTDRDSITGRLGIPDTVPSGLLVDN